jgi:ATP-dependent DNA helicase RecG
MFQVLEDTEVRVNESLRGPLLQTFERVDQLFSARVVEREVQVGLFRVSVPNVDRHAFREAIINALTHRDLARMGAVHIQWTERELLISNPGGFVEGVTLQNILVVPPRPRNPTLADALKRIGLGERTGRGVDRIFEGMLRSGLRLPDYSRSDSSAVVLRLPQGDADLPFVEMIVEAERREGRPLPIDSLLVLGALRDEARIDTERASMIVQRPTSEAKAVVARLVDAGLLEAHGQTRARSYTLSPRVYRAIGKSSAYVRQTGFDSLQQEQMILKWVRKHGPIRRSQVAELCKLHLKQASRLLARMVQNRQLVMSGSKKTAIYDMPNA